MAPLCVLAIFGTGPFTYWPEGGARPGEPSSTCASQITNSLTSEMPVRSPRGPLLIMQKSRSKIVLRTNTMYRTDLVRLHRFSDSLDNTLYQFPNFMGCKISQCLLNKFSRSQLTALLYIINILMGLCCCYRIC